jgi:hypothetical protein
MLTERLDGSTSACRLMGLTIDALDNEPCRGPGSTLAHPSDHLRPRPRGARVSPRVRRQLTLPACASQLQSTRARFEACASSSAVCSPCAPMRCDRPDLVMLPCKSLPHIVGMGAPRPSGHSAARPWSANSLNGSRSQARTPTHAALRLCEPRYRTYPPREHHAKSGGSRHLCKFS